jgi:hypothetical protein
MTLSEMLISEQAAKDAARIAEPLPVCPKCGGSTCIVKCGPLYHHNLDGYEWPIVSAEDPVESRRNIQGFDFATVNRKLIRNPSHY